MLQKFKSTFSEQIIELDGCSSDELMLLAAAAASRLGWEARHVGRQRSEFRVDAVFASWGERVTISRIEGEEGRLLARSELADRKTLWDYGKNKENLEKLAATIPLVDRDRKDNPSELVALAFSDDEETGGEGKEAGGEDKEAGKGCSFLSLLVSREGYVATPLLLDTNVAWFVGMLVWGVCHLEPWTVAAIKWGANYAPLTLTGDWWRAAASNFVHHGFFHLLLNMVALPLIGIFVETAFGGRKVVAGYVLTGLFSALAYLAVHPTGLGAGASGPIYGLCGMFLAWLVCNRELDWTDRTMFSLGMVAVLFFGLLQGLNDAHVSTAAHLGGLASGLLLGLA